jgi:hypothetical protein
VCAFSQEINPSTELPFKERPIYLYVFSEKSEMRGFILAHPDGSFSYFSKLQDIAKSPQISAPSRLIIVCADPGGDVQFRHVNDFFIKESLNGGFVDVERIMFLEDPIRNKIIVEGYLESQKASHEEQREHTPSTPPESNR